MTRRASSSVLTASLGRRPRLFIATVLGVVVATVAITLATPPTYTATTSLMIDNRTERVLDAQAVLSGLPADAATVDTEVELLRSRELAGRVVDELGLANDPEFNTRPLSGSSGSKRSSAASRRDLVIDALRHRLQVDRIGMTYVMNVNVTSIDPEKAATIANAIVDTYLLEQREAKLEATDQASDWLDDRLAGLRDEVFENEAAVERYRSGNALLSASGATLTEQEISTYNTELAAVKAEQAEEEARLSTARAQMARGSRGDDVAEALGSSVIQQLRTNRAEVSGRVADLTSRYGPRHPDRQGAESELADIDRQIQAEIGRIVSNLEARVQIARQRTASMQSSLARATGTLAANNNAGVRLHELERNAEASRSQYQALLERFKQTTNLQGLQAPDARIVSRAAIPNVPSSPDIVINLLLGLILGVGAGAAVVAIAERFERPRFRTISKAVAAE